MKICVFGAGAVGGHLAVKLGNVGADPLVIARGPHLEAMRRSGLRMRAGDQEFSARVRCADSIAACEAQDVIIVSVKAPALPATAASLAQLAHPDTAIVYALNGIPWWYFHGADGPHVNRQLPSLDPEGALWNQVGPQRAIGCVVYSANEVIEPGVIINRSPQRNIFTLGEPDGSTTKRVSEIAELLATAGVQSTVTNDIRAAIWRKFIVGNLTLSIAATLTGMTADALVSGDDMSKVCRLIAAEGYALAKSLGVDLGEFDLDKLLHPSAIPRGNRPSMLQDFERGRSMEIDSFVTVIEDLAKASAVPMPTFNIAASLLKAKAEAAGLWQRR